MVMCKPYYQNASQWVLPDLRTQELVSKRDIRRAPIFRPFLQVIADVYDGVCTEIQLNNIGFEFALSKILFAGTF